jgi:hypothetical protein
MVIFHTTSKGKIIPFSVAEWLLPLGSQSGGTPLSVAFSRGHFSLEWLSSQADSSLNF